MNLNSLIGNSRVHIAFFVIIAAVMLIHNGSVSLWDQDEAAYSGFAKNMLESGDWLIPDYPWSKIHRKPPLHFWNIALSYQVFGVNEFAVRFPSVLFLWLTLLVAYLGSRPFLNRDTAFLSVVIMSTSLFVLSLAKISVTDATLLFFETVCAISVLRQMTKPNWRNVLWFWLAFAMALLVKGPPVIIFTGVFAVLLFVLHPQRMRLLGFHPWFFLPIAFIPLLAWGYIAWQQDGGTFISWMIDWYILKRIGGSVLGQSAPFGSHFLFIAASFGLYLFAWPALWRDGMARWKQRDTVWIMLMLWFVAAWFPYELTPSKLPAYTVVAHLPMAILLSQALRKYDWSRLGIGWVVAQAVFTTLFVIGLPLAGWFMGLHAWFMVSSSMLSVLLAVALMFGLKRLRKGAGPWLLIGFNVLFVTGMWSVVYPQIDVIKNSPIRVAQALAGTEHGETVVVANHKGHPPSLIFYLEREFEQVVLESDVARLREWAADSAVVLVLNEEQYQQLKSESLVSDAETTCSLFTDRKGQMCYYVVQDENN